MPAELRIVTIMLRVPFGANLSECFGIHSSHLDVLRANHDQLIAMLCYIILVQIRYILQSRRSRQEGKRDYWLINSGLCVLLWVYARRAYMLSRGLPLIEVHEYAILFNVSNR